jgi:thiol-disulfide isomerase/thioredoxin
VNKKLLWGIVLSMLIIAGGVLFYSSVSKEPETVKEDITDNEEELDKEEIVIEDTQEANEVTADIAKGELAPDFTLVNLDGKEVSLSDYKGKTVLVNFWATWCGFCDMEMPDLNKLDKENDDLVVLAVNVMEEKDIVQEYIDEGGYEFEVVLDSDGAITRNYLVSGFPTSYFIDKEGVLLGGVPGMLTYDQMNEILDSIKE